VTDPRVEAPRDGPVAAGIRRARLIAVLRRVEPRAALVTLVEELVSAGVRAIEITWDAPDAAADVAVLRAHLDDLGQGDVLLGGGTLTRREELEAAAAAGAAFGVSPTFDPHVVTAAVELGVPFLPGAFTPTEIAAAWAAGATFVKLFPASALGPAFVRELRAPLPHVGLVPTGGIDAASAEAFLAAGAAAVGVGGALVRGTPGERREIVAAVGGASAR
jgi:2-dehydro-3-deoxyphosphogluconate aldolase / (4S)-4-hydroxy-2-oxoglutarate aldolase